MHEKLAKALGFVDEKYIDHAAKRKNHRARWVVGIAAVLALVLFLRIPAIPLAISAKAVALAPESRLGERPKSGTDAWRDWYRQQDQRRETVEQNLGTVADFAAAGSFAALTGGEENPAWSPINAYIALALAAELAGGETRETVLDALGVADVKTLRESVSAIWEYICRDDGKEICTLANSLWLQKGLEFEPQVMDDMAYHYYTSIYQGKLNGKDIQNWVQNQTGGMFSQRMDPVVLPDDALLVLASTIHFQSQWQDKFNAGNNQTLPFHAPGGDVTATYLHREEAQMHYYWGPDFGAVELSLKHGSSMWFFLPDEDKTVEDVLRNGDYMDTVLGNGESKYMKVNLSVPKFDVTSSADLMPAFEKMGLGGLFDPDACDLSTAFPGGDPLFFTGVQQQTRVTVDEEGVTAASYILLPGEGAAPPPEEIIDFVLDRPFVYVITSYDGVPLFTGVVHDPAGK